MVWDTCQQGQRKGLFVNMTFCQLALLSTCKISSSNQAISSADICACLLNLTVKLSIVKCSKHPKMFSYLPFGRLSRHQGRPGACSIKHVGFVIYRKLTNFTISWCLFYCQSQTHKLPTESEHYKSMMFYSTCPKPLSYPLPAWSRQYISCGQCYKTFYVHYLRNFMIS